MAVTSLGQSLQQYLVQQQSRRSPRQTQRQVRLTIPNVHIRLSGSLSTVLKEIVILRVMKAVFVPMVDSFEVHAKRAAKVDYYQFVSRQTD